MIYDTLHSKTVESIEFYKTDIETDPPSMLSNSEEQIHEFKQTSHLLPKNTGNFTSMETKTIKTTKQSNANYPTFSKNPTQKEKFTATQFRKQEIESKKCNYRFRI